MPISVNMTGVSIRKEPLPPGYYQAAVSKCEQAISKTGNPKVAWQFRITGPEEFIGRKAYYDTSLLHDALWKLQLLLVGLGFSKEEVQGDDEGNLEFEPSDMLGLECTLVVIEDEYKGETTGKVDQVLPAGTEE